MPLWVPGIVSGWVQGFQNILGSPNVLKENGTTQLHHFQFLGLIISGLGLIPRPGYRMTMSTSGP